MSKDSLPFWTLLLAVTLLTTGQVLRADDTPADSDDIKVVPIQSGNSTVNVQVKEPSNPYRNVSSSPAPDKYHPDQIDYSATSPWAHKQFMSSGSPLSKSDAFFQGIQQSPFITKSYPNGLPTQANHFMPNLDTQVSLPASNAANSHTDDFDKSFSTSSFDASQNQTAELASKASTDENRTAALGAKTPATFSSPLASKTFQGSDADNIRHDLTKINEGLMGMKDLPNRPLTIDEVRALINHGVKPDTSLQPPPPTKPLNNPDYKPEASPEPPPAPAQDDNKSDVVPSPGMMAEPPPVNSDPLPNH